MIPRNAVYEGSCLDIMTDMDPGSVDLILTDPPYGISFQSNMPVEGAGKDLIHNDGIEAWRKLMPRYLKQAKLVLKDGGILCMFCAGGGPTSVLPEAWQTLGNFLKVETCLVWDRMDIGLGWRYRPQWEAILVAVKGERRVWRGPQNRSNVLRYPRIIPQAGEHPTPKPVPLLAVLVSDNSEPGALVLDPFCGGGPALEAAHTLGRDWIGIELEGKYAEMSRRRMDSLVSQPIIPGLEITKATQEAFYP
jgi:DNA modification methylase